MSHVPMCLSQRRQIDLLMAGLDEGSEVAGLIVDEEYLGDKGEEESTYSWMCTKHIGKLFALCELAAEYIFEATVKCGILLICCVTLHVLIHIIRSSLCSIHIKYECTCGAYNKMHHLGPVMCHVNFLLAIVRI